MFDPLKNGVGQHEVVNSKLEVALVAWGGPRGKDPCGAVNRARLEFISCFETR